ncbi:unnamed protein product, partial [Bubo scandiacus]
AGVLHNRDSYAHHFHVMATLGTAVGLPGLSPHGFGEKHLASSFTPASSRGKKICLRVGLLSPAKARARGREMVVGRAKGYSSLASTGSSLPGMESKPYCWQPFAINSHKSL